MSECGYGPRRRVVEAAAVGRMQTWRHRNNERGRHEGSGWVKTSGSRLFGATVVFCEPFLTKP